MASDIWLRTILIVRKEPRCRHIGYSYRLAAMVLLYAPSHRQDNTYHGLCYTSRGALAGTRNSSMKDRSDDPSHHERTLYTSELRPALRQGKKINIYIYIYRWSLVSARVDFDPPGQYILFCSKFPRSRNNYYRAASNIRGNLTDFQNKWNLK